MMCARGCKVRAKRTRTRGKENHTTLTLTRTHAHHLAQKKNITKRGARCVDWGELKELLRLETSLSLSLSEGSKRSREMKT